MNVIETPALSEDVANALLDCTCINLRVASRVLTRLYDEALEPSGIRITQLATLAALAFHGPFTVKSLATALVMDRTTLTADLKPLEAQGFVSIAPGTDRRTRMVSISPAGRLALHRAIPLWQTTQQSLAVQIGSVRLKSFLSDLREVIDVAKRH